MIICQYVLNGHIKNANIQVQGRSISETFSRFYRAVDSHEKITSIIGDQRSIVSESEYQEIIKVLSNEHSNS